MKLHHTGQTTQLVSSWDLSVPILPFIARITGVCHYAGFVSGFWVFTIWSSSLGGECFTDCVTAPAPQHFLTWKVLSRLSMWLGSIHECSGGFVHPGYLTKQHTHLETRTRARARTRTNQDQSHPQGLKKQDNMPAFFLRGQPLQTLPVGDRSWLFKSSQTWSVGTDTGQNWTEPSCGAGEGFL